MTDHRGRMLLVIGLGLAAFFIGALLGPPPPSTAQEPTKPLVITQEPAKPAAATPAPASDNYVGAETCKGCHDEAWNKFAKTRMGRLFLYQARDANEKNACENCHGPGKAHVEAGGGKGVGGLI